MVRARAVADRDFLVLYPTTDDGVPARNVPVSHESLRVLASGYLLVSPTLMLLTSLKTKRIMAVWRKGFIRQFGATGDALVFVAGRRCELGEGEHQFYTPHARKALDILLASREASGRPSTVHGASAAPRQPPRAPAVRANDRNPDDEEDYPLHELSNASLRQSLILQPDGITAALRADARPAPRLASTTVLSPGAPNGDVRRNSIGELAAVLPTPTAMPDAERAGPRPGQLDRSRGLARGHYPSSREPDNANELEAYYNKRI